MSICYLIDLQYSHASQLVTTTRPALNTTRPMADAATSLSPDIQRAIQQAVGNANDAAHISEKKKKKRSRDTEPDETGTEHAQDAEKRRKKKKDTSS